MKPILTIAWLHIRRSWRAVAAAIAAVIGLAIIYLRHRAKGKAATDQALDDRVVELAEDVVIANARHTQEIAAVKARDDARRAEVVAAATDPDRAQRLGRLAQLMRRPSQ